MNDKKEIKKIKVNNGAELVAQAKEYKNSGGEWKLLERYIEMPWNSSKFGGKRKNKLGWVIIISNGKQTVDIFSLEHNIDYKDFVEKDLISFDEINVRPELWQLFPEAKFAHFDKGNEKLNTATCKELKKDNEDYSLYRYLVAENFHHLKLIIKDYFCQNETKIYNSPNRRFSDWVEIVDGRDGNMYLYVGGRNTNGGREIKIGISKSEFKNKGEWSEKINLEVSWDLLIMSADQPLTSEEKEKSYKYLEEEFQNNWPLREKLCWGYWENMLERMEEKADYWKEKTQQKEYLGKKENKEFLLARARADTIRMELSKNKNIKICSDKCNHALFIPKRGNPNPKLPKPTSNEITEAEKKQLNQYFLDHHISKISVENGQLKIEYSQKEHQAVNISELEKYRQFIQNTPSHSISLSDLQEKNNSSPSQTNPNNNKLVIGLISGVGAVVLLGVIIYFWKKLLPKRT